MLYSISNKYKFIINKPVLLDKLTEVERENRILLEKMKNILQNKNKAAPDNHPYNAVSSSYGRLDSSSI